MADQEHLRARLQRRYGDLAVVAGDEATRPDTGGGCGSRAGAAAGSPAGTGGGSAGATGCCRPAAEAGQVWGAAHYDAADRGGVAAGLVDASLGCGNPVAVAELRPGETVLDLGSGSGLDVILSARRVAPGGHAYGLDMTEAMLAAARANAASEGVANATFLAGCLEAIPLPAGAVDVVLSNCVLNLSADKPAAFAEMHRVLRPGGRLAISDVVADRELPAHRRADPEAWDACLAGAVTRPAYREHLAAAGFTDASLTDSHSIDDLVSSVIVRARRPA